MTSVDPDEQVAWLSMASAKNPGLWAFLKSLSPGGILSGTVAAVERFGVFVALDEGPEHPVFPGVGFNTIPELSWQRFEEVSDIVRVGERVSCAFLYFDTWNGEARLSLRATQPDSFRTSQTTSPWGRSCRGRSPRCFRPVLSFGSPMVSKGWSIFESWHRHPWKLLKKLSE
ncbi:S1 RNA-binding domain-containing protein [Streptomyces roseus]|uniref:S1 RNA-binding domain-containing protein n=1 Tax=Streptomyces roseus TaxID=66430 RepID=UPI003820C35A